MNEIETDVLIIGAGVAGLVTALNARSRRVCVLWPGTDTASDLAQGGIAAAIDAHDSPERHLDDTLRAGCHLNSVPTAQLVCREAPAAVSYLSSLGVRFTREDGELSLHVEAAHSHARVVHVGGDATGAAIMNVLRRRVADVEHVDLAPRTRATALLRGADGIRGAVAITEGGRTLVVRARDVVIATGGVGGLYSRSTNPHDACGDGPAMALAAGARCDGLEFVQFHPTALDVDARPLPLMTEALRGAGARLLDDSGAYFMRDMHPLGELAPRDVVARAVYGVHSAGSRVWLDATRLVDTSVADEFPSIYKTCRAHGIDPSREPIPVTSAAHYHMGGIAVDLDGRTSVPGLWAVGEAACTGLHGANRLASNSLLEAVVFGRRVGGALNREQRGRTDALVQVPEIEPEESFVQRDLRGIMWKSMGVIRSGTGLEEGLSLVTRLRERVAPRALLRRSQLLLAEQMMLAAARRRTSCGAHHRVG